MRALKSADIKTDHRSEAALSAADLRGIFLPIPTPFDEAGDLDLPALRSNIGNWNATGINGYVMLGSTGERVNLNEREYLEVVSAARAEIGSATGLRFIVGAGQQSTRETINETERVAPAVAVDAFLIITPHFYRSSITQAALVEHYLTVAEACPAPVILYSMPALTGIKIEPETAARLSEHQNIIGIKDSSADIDGLQKTIALVRKDFAVLTGNGTVLHAALQAGAVGGILAVACVAPALSIEIFQASELGERERADELQASLTPLATAVTTKYGIGGLKAALEMKGYVGGAVRAPLRGAGEDARADIRECLSVADNALSGDRVLKTSLRPL
jgi:4-hydroxy-2-oxoglutarate aldolase